MATLAPLLKTAIEKGTEEFGKSSVGLLFDKFKQRLKPSGAKEALEDLAKQPDDAAAQGALNIQLRKALSSDPELAAFLQEWMTQSGVPSAVTQIANTTGDNNKTIQIVGSGNSVT